MHLLTVAATFGTIAAAFPSCRPNRALTFSRNGTFQISILEDLHFGECEFLNNPGLNGDVLIQQLLVHMGQLRMLLRLRQ